MFLVKTLAFLCFCSIVVAKSSRAGLIFVPGSFCSLIEVRINASIVEDCPKSLTGRWILLWLNLEFFAEKNFRCFEKVFSFVFDETTESFRSPNGVETRIRPKSRNNSFLDGILWEYFGLDVLFENLKRKENFRDGFNLQSFPFDFRRGNQQFLDEFAENLRSTIETMSLENENQPVDLLSHSTGGSMVLYFLSKQNQAWKNRFVRFWISLSGNFAGEVDNLGNIFQGFFSPFINKEIIRTWDFFGWRAPEPLIYGSQRVLVQTDKRNYSAADLEQLFDDFGANNLSKIYRKSSALLADLPSPNVTTFCFFGANLSTLVAYRFDENQHLEKVFGSGDGEQDDLTNMSCRLWTKTMPEDKKLIVEPFDSVRHTELVSNRRVLERIFQIIG